jgi:hypothetical protein
MIVLGASTLAAAAPLRRSTRAASSSRFLPRRVSRTGRRAQQRQRGAQETRTLRSPGASRRGTVLVCRIGQKNGLVRQWARRGTRPTQPADQRYDNAYLFGAICPARGVGAALALPYADTDMMQLHLNEISRNIAEGAHAVLLLDRAGWHTTGKLDVPKTSRRSSCLPAPRS